MSGGCCSPLGPGTGPVVAFYQTIEDDGAPLPQRSALNLINSTLADNAGNGSTDLTLHYQFWQNSDGDVPQRRAVHPNSLQFDLTDDGAGDATRFALHSPISPQVAVTTFRATYYVDPLFVGVSAGSESNPFLTVADCVTAAAALALVSATIKLAPGCNLTENVVLPATGNDWEIRCDHFAVGSVAATITGTVTVNATASVRYRLTDIRVTGNITGNSGGSSQLVLTGVVAAGGITLTGGWAALQFVGRGTPNLNSFGGSVAGACVTTGPIFASQYTFAGSLTWASIGTMLSSCRFGAAVGFTLTGVANGVFLGGCTFSAAPVFTSASNNLLTFDPFSFGSLMSVGGLTFAGGGTFTVKTLASNISAAAGFNNNVGVVSLLANAPAGMYRADNCLDITASGTAGTAVENIIYTDLNGTVQTLPVTSPGLVITAAVGTEARGSVVFRHKGGAAISTSLTGIVTPGAFAGLAEMVLTKLD